MKILLPLLLALPLSGCFLWNDIETDPAEITTTVGEWEPPMVETLTRLQTYRPDLSAETQEFILVFSQQGDTEVMVQDVADLKGLLLTYIDEVNADESLSASQKDLEVAIPRVWLTVLKKYLGR